MAAALRSRSSRRSAGTPLGGADDILVEAALRGHGKSARRYEKIYIFEKHGTPPAPFRLFQQPASAFLVYIRMVVHNYSILLVV